MTTSVTGSQVRVGDVELYAEVRGDGPPLVLVPGGGGDGGQFAALATLLAAGRTVVTYDRRGNSRSGRGTGSPSTSVEQQADDVVGLLGELGLGPATLVGTSQGASIALAAALQAPHRCARVVLHDPAVMTVLADPDGALAAVQPVIGAGMAAGGPAGGAEAFFRFTDEPGFEAVPAETRARMLGNAQVLFESEFGVFSGWRPDAARLAGLGVPLVLIVGERTAPFFAEAAAWLAAASGADVHAAPGGHLGYAEHPARFADLLLGLTGDS